MTRLAFALLALHLWTQPLAAQDSDAPSPMERGMQQFLEGLLQEMEPALEGMRGFMEEMGPAMAELLAEIKDWSVYEPPEVLDNGDIIIRRKPDAVPEVPEDPGDMPPQIDL
jgi:hypothetical protein